MGMSNPIESDPLTLFEKQSELKRILESKHFARAPKRRQFLEFTSGQVFAGQGGKLNEYLIGVEVYERGTDFDPKRDPIVRVQAHEIRHALTNYYQEEGKESLVRVELHPGHYAPIFRRVEFNSEAPAAPTAQGKVTGADIRRQTSHWQYAIIILLSSACAILGFLSIRESLLLHQRLESGAVAASLPGSEEWFWKPFLVHGSQPLVVIPTPPVLRFGTDADSSRTLRGGYAIPKSKMSEFEDTVQFSEQKSFIFVPTATDYTGIGDALGLLSLSRFFLDQGVMIRAKTSRLTDFPEVQGGNTILLGGTTNWTDRVYSGLGGFIVSGGAIKNVSPRPGEPPLYTPKFDPITNNLVRDYALVVMRPNEVKGDRLLILEGIYTQGTGAAANYVTNVRQLAELRKALLAASPRRKTIPSFFEALLSVPVENYVPGRASLVAVRIIRQ